VRAFDYERPLVDEETLAHYRRHGFAIIRGAASERFFELAGRLVDAWADFNIRLWMRQGLIEADFSEEDRWHRYLHAWRAAGRPHHRRNPNHHLINETMYDLMRLPSFIEIASRVFETPELCIHGIFNARPQVPDNPEDGLLTTKWHQDGQFWFQDYGAPEPDQEAKTHVMTMWIPLQRVDENSGALQVFSTEQTANQFFPVYDHDYKRTGTVGLSPEDSARYTPIPAPMERGDVLIITQRTPHAACAPMTVDRLRWSIDLRYEATATRTVHGRKYGFVVNSVDPALVTPVEAWVSKREPPNP
jgi:hypothetical protein